VSGAIFDVITTGRVGVDLYPLQSGRTLAAVATFAKSLGGSPTNVAVAAARLGCSTAVITKVGDDPFGTFVRQALHGYGVDDRWVGTDPQLRTPIAFCELFPPDHFPILFYRQPVAPDLRIEAAELDVEAIAAARVFWTTSTGLSAEPSRSALITALEARGEDRSWDERPTIHDLDYRPGFWSSARDAGRAIRDALRYATVAVGNREEVAVAVGTRDPRKGAAALLDLGPQLAIVKCGGAGVYAAAADGTELTLDAVPVHVVNGLGAGDAFGGALCAGIVHGWGLEVTLQAANAAGAHVAARLGCAPEMPTREQLRALAGMALDA